MVRGPPAAGCQCSGATAPGSGPLQLVTGVVAARVLSLQDGLQRGEGQDGYHQRAQGD
jgi:hypothetical protein